MAVFPYVALAETLSKGALSLAGFPGVCAWLRRVRALPGFVAQDGIYIG